MGLACQRPAAPRHNYQLSKMGHRNFCETKIIQIWRKELIRKVTDWTSTKWKMYFIEKTNYCLKIKTIIICCKNVKQVFLTRRSSLQVRKWTYEVQVICIWGKSEQELLEFQLGSIFLLWGFLLKECQPWIFCVNYSHNP